MKQNKKGKPAQNTPPEKWKFNPVDIAAVILIAAVALFVVVKLAMPKKAVPEHPVTMTYTVMAEAVPRAMYETVKAHVPGRLMASGKMLDGEVKSVELRPYYILSDGEWREDLQHVNLVFTVVHTYKNAGDVLMSKVDAQEIRVGRRDYILKTQYIEFYGAAVLDIQWDTGDDPAWNLAP